MAYSFNGSSQYLTTASTPVTAVPCTLVGWFRPANVSAAKVIFCVGRASGPDRFQLSENQTGSQPAQAGVVDSSSSGSFALSTGTVSSGAWHHFAGVFTNNASRTAYLDGANSASETTSRTPASLDALQIGARYGTSYGVFANGDISGVALWNVALTADEIASLAKGLAPNRVRPQSLVFWPDMHGRTLRDLKAARTITNNGSATVSANPRIYR